MWQFLVKVDKYINFVFGGEPNQTISARAGMAACTGNKAACRLCKFLDRFDKDHCLKEAVKWLKSF